eukprot:scaffold33508_cov96-Skeletonema_dohrnii-CCMP3373.AAC.5
MQDNSNTTTRDLLAQPTKEAGVVATESPKNENAVKVSAFRLRSLVYTYVGQNYMRFREAVKLNQPTAKARDRICVQTQRQEDGGEIVYGAATVVHRTP